MKKTNNSLGDRLRTAKSTEEITSLLGEGKSYDLASAKTQRRWKRLAARRSEALTAPKSEPSAPTPAHKGDTKKHFKKKS